MSKQAPSTEAGAILRFLRRRRAADRERPLGFLRDLPRIWPYLRPNWPLAALSLVLMAAAAGVALVAPWPLAILVDTVLSGKPLPSLLGPLGHLSRETLLIITVTSGFLVTGFHHGVSVLQNYVDTKLEQRMALDFKTDLFHQVQKLSLAYHDRKSTGMMMFQIIGESAAIGSITVGIPPVIQSVVTLVGMSVIAYLIDPTLALVSLIAVPLVYRSTGHYLRRVQPRLMAVRGIEGRAMEILVEALGMLRVIRAFGREGHELQRLREQGERGLEARVQLTLRQTLFSLGVELITAGTTAAVLGVGAHHVLDRRLSVGELLVLMGYIAAIHQPLQQLSGALSSFQQQFNAFRFALDLLDEEPHITDASDAIEIGRARGEIVFDGVSFAHEERARTLVELSFQVPAGHRLGIVGVTGAGKSTLVSLIPRFYDVREGCITLDGVDIRRLTIQSLREQISIVLQEPLLFSGTIYENIRYGRLEASREEIEAAARAASAHDFISGLPQGYETPIGERGSRLSGGERQRISIARAFLKDSPILILDEPTSAIDTHTEAEIISALELLMEGRTTFVIAHRLSTLRNVDSILVLSDGEIVEHGRHDELLAIDGAYRRLYEAQQRHGPEGFGEARDIDFQVEDAYG